MPKSKARELRARSRSLTEENALLRAKHVKSLLRAQRLLLRLKAQKKAKR